MKLFLIEGSKTGQSYELNPPGVSIGRETDNDVILEEEGSSRYHSKLDWKDGEWVLKDLGSTNGTKLNGTRIKSDTVLQEGDKIKIGKHILLFGTSLDSKHAEKTPEAPAPATVVEPVPAKKEEPPKKESIDSAKTDAVQEEKKSFMNFFSSKDAPPTLDKSSANLDGGSEKLDFFSKKDTGTGQKRKHASPLFYVIVIISAVLLLLLFLLFDKIQTETPKQTTSSTKKAPGITLLVDYEKQISSKDNIFRYHLSVRNDKIVVTRDDLKLQIRSVKDKKLDSDSIQKLESDLKQTDFMTLAQQQDGISSDDTDEIKTLTVAYGTNLNTIRIKNTFEPTSFRDAVSVLDDFSNNYLKISTVPLTADEMKEKADEAFRKAEQLFQNYQAKDDNLREAISRYGIVLDYLECFEPKPDIYDKAYQQSQEARRIMEADVKSSLSEAEKNYRMGKYEDAKNDYQKVTAKLPQDDKRYELVKQQIIKIDKFLRKPKKR